MIHSFLTFEPAPRDVFNPETGLIDFPLRLAPDGAPQVLAFPLADPREDAPQILARLNAAAEQFGRSPWIRQATESILPPFTANNDLFVVLRSIASFVRDCVRYLPDPEGGELFISPVVMLERIDANGFAFGDCDDHVLLLNSMARSVGLLSRAVGVRLENGSLWDHVISQVYVFGRWLDVDPCVKTNETRDYREKLI